MYFEIFINCNLGFAILQQDIIRPIFEEFLTQLAQLSVFQLV
jgi:hypothetical protein